MSGYKRDIVIRIVPVNGAEAVHWFTDRLTDLGIHTACVPVYPRTMTMREDINRILRPRVITKRAQIAISVAIASMADQWFLQEIEEALDDPLNYSVFLSLDGGVVEREVVWLDSGGVAPVPVVKTCVGATFTLSLQTKEPVGPRGPMMTDPGLGREFLQNGSFEEWTGGNPVAWFSSPASGGETITVAQTGTNVFDGASAALITRAPTGGQYLQVASDAITGFQRNCWYQVIMRFRGSVAGSANVNVTAYSPSRTDFQVRPDGKTWVQFGGDVMPTFTPASASYSTVTAFVRMPPWYDSQTLVYLRTSSYYVGSVRLDGCSFYGPVLRPGYSTW